MKTETFQTNKGPMSEKTLLDYLVYASYRTQRKQSPHILPEQWATVYGPCTKGMEERFQAESVIQVEAVS